MIQKKYEVSVGHDGEVIYITEVRSNIKLVEMTLECAEDLVRILRKEIMFTREDLK